MSLGLVATGKRSIRSGKEYDKYFESATVKGNEVVLIPDGDVYDTLKLMKQVVNQTLSQTAAIAKELEGASLEQTCRNIWNFLYTHIQYKKDHAKREQLRTPARSWRDRATGIDCDCFAIFISSILTNLGIKHTFRMAGYKGDFQHVYVVVPIDGKSLSVRNNYYVIDPVVDRFNYEVPFKKKHDHKIMGKVTMLNGFGSADCSTKPEIYRLRKFVDTQEVILFGYVPTKLLLDTERIPYIPAFDKESEQSYYIVNTASGPVSIPTIITKEQAEQVKNLKFVSPCACEDIPASKKKFPWWWLAIGAGALILLTGDDQEEVKSGLKGLAGLAGVKTKTTKRKKKKSYRTLTV